MVDGGLETQVSQSQATTSSNDGAAVHESMEGRRKEKRRVGEEFGEWWDGRRMGEREPWAGVEWALGVALVPQVNSVGCCSLCSRWQKAFASRGMPLSFDQTRFAQKAVML